jgi:mannose-1-phosphate guanylyltransferase
MLSSHSYGLILAGGRGTRFWPASRTKTPKQLLSFTGNRSLLQETADRLAPLIPPERLWILTNEHLRAAVRKQLPSVPARQILAEPAQRNTAPCLGMAAHLIHRHDPQAVLGVFPADHYIAKPALFRTFVKTAFATAAKQATLVTLGVEPRWPETGYGYLEFPAGTVAGSRVPVKLSRFREKPDLATAQQFLAAGNYFWNAGMFFWRAAKFNDAMRRYLPKTATLLASLPAVSSSSFASQLRRIYPKCDNISVDFGIMEKAAPDGIVHGLATGDIGWNDLGSWSAIHALLERDSSGNALRTPAVLIGAEGCLVQAPGKLVALIGVKDLVVVDTPHALLVAHRDEAQSVGQIVKLLEHRKRSDLL